MSNQIVLASVSQVAKWTQEIEVKALYSNMLGKEAASYLASAVNLVRNEPSLQQCTMRSLKAAVMTPAILKLSIEKTLGQAWIIAYKEVAQFQIGYKGIIQLCIRSGKYHLIHCSEIYQDELQSHNPITGQVLFHPAANFEMRKSGKPGDVIGHYAYFKLLSGFEKGDYMTCQEAMAHAKRYSQAYNADLKYGKQKSPWSLHPILMGNNTILKRLLNKWGIKSIEMQRAMDNEAWDASAEQARDHIDANQGATDLDAGSSDLTPQQRGAKTRADNKAKREAAAAEKAKAEAEAQSLQQPEQQTQAKEEPGRPLQQAEAAVQEPLGPAGDAREWRCNKCHGTFEEPTLVGSLPNQIAICPYLNCLDKDVERI